MGRPSRLHAPFSLQDLRQIKADPGKLSENPDKYVEVLKGLPQSFELAWKDEMLLLTQTLTSTEMTAALRAAIKYADQDPSDAVSQLTWTALSQEFYNRPQMFGQMLAKDLSEFSHPRVSHDDILCASTEEASQESNGNSFIERGICLAGCAVVTLNEMAESAPLPPGTSAQLTELAALIRALEPSKDLRISPSTYSWSSMIMPLFGKRDIIRQPLAQGGFGGLSS